ncbi:MAG: hypothetical protein J7M13_02260 [Synergistetes bacterium]|nr:hypothetical protein [Synergistota bacterium]
MRICCLSCGALFDDFEEIWLSEAQRVLVCPYCGIPVFRGDFVCRESQEGG